MRLHSLATFCCVALAVPLVASGPQTPAGAHAGHGSPAGSGDWIPLFDGTSLQGWRGYRQADASQTRWTAENGMLTLPARAPGAPARSRDIITRETFDQFELAWEWRVSPGGNSGVKYFVLEDNDSAIGHEYQIIDDERHADAKTGTERQTAAFYDVLAPADRTLRPAGSWNSSRVIVRGQQVEHYLNDGKVLTYELGSPALAAAIDDSKFNKVERFGKLQKGHILLQDHGDQVWYRNIRIKRLATPSS